MTRHLEESERAMQERVQRLEALRLSLEEVRPHRVQRGIHVLRTLERPSVSAVIGLRIHP